MPLHFARGGCYCMSASVSALSQTLSTLRPTADCQTLDKPCALSTLWHSDKPGGHSTLSLSHIPALTFPIDWTQVSTSFHMAPKTRPRVPTIAKLSLPRSSAQQLYCASLLISHNKILFTHILFPRAQGAIAGIRCHSISAVGSLHDHGPGLYHPTSGMGACTNVA